MKHIVIASALMLSGISFAHAEGPPPLTKFLKLFDLNGDGVLNEEERQAAKLALELKREEFIAKWDTNHDGKLSADEIQKLRRAIIEQIIAKRRAVFLKFAGEDELMSKEEFAHMPIFAEKDPVNVVALFERLDHDHDGSLTFAEFNFRFIQYPR